MEIKYKFGREQEIEIDGKKVIAFYQDKFTQPNNFDPSKKTIVVKMSIFGKRGDNKYKIQKFAWFASFDKGISFEFLQTTKA